MRVIVWSINYAPEVTGISPHNVALCEFLQRRGDDVEMLTTFSYYPAWRKRPEDRGQFYRTDVINGVPVHRCWHYVPARVSAWKRIIHEGTFVVTSTLRGLFLRGPDVYVVVSPPLSPVASVASLDEIDPVRAIAIARHLVNCCNPLPSVTCLALGLPPSVAVHQIPATEDDVGDYLLE